MKNNNPTSKKDPFWMVIVAAFLATLLGIGFLSWQYHKTAEEKMDSQEQIMEENSAKNLLKEFMEKRIEGNEEEAGICLTENAMEQKNKGNFFLISNFKSFEIIKTEMVNETEYLFTIKIKEGNGNNYLIEIIKLTKILDKYYIDSVEIAG